MSHGTKSAVLGCKVHNETLKTKQLVSTPRVTTHSIMAICIIFLQYKGVIFFLLLFSNDEENAVEFQVSNENVDKWEIPRDRIILKESIGHGAFGAIWRACLRQPDGKLGTQTVAVKCCTRKLH